MVEVLSVMKAFEKASRTKKNETWHHSWLHLNLRVFCLHWNMPQKCPFFRCFSMFWQAANASPAPTPGPSECFGLVPYLQHRGHVHAAGGFLGSAKTLSTECLLKTSCWLGFFFGKAGANKNLERLLCFCFSFAWKYLQKIYRRTKQRKAQPLNESLRPPGTDRKEQRGPADLTKMVSEDTATGKAS